MRYPFDQNLSFLFFPSFFTHFLGFLFYMAALTGGIFSFFCPVVAFHMGFAYCFLDTGKVPVMMGYPTSVKNGDCG
jgi:hypothetical protein